MLQDNYYPLIFIIALPLAGTILNGFLLDWIGRALGKKAHRALTSRVVVGTIANLAIAGAFFAALYIIVFHLPLMKSEAEEGKPWLSYTLWNWIKAGAVSIDLKLLLDPLSAVMTLIVSGVSAVIHFYSLGYMSHDPSYRRFFTYLNLFVFFMLMLVLGDNLAVMFIGWEGVGLCSYLLIGFWYEDRAKAVAGKKAFVVNRIGDFGFILGIFLIGTTTGHLDFEGIRNNIHLFSGEVFGISTVTIACLLLFLGATGKSAQIPLYIWLPDAMAGPTPVSALIHAATMVTAGVYMIARLNFLYLASPPAMAVVALIGALTAVLAAAIGFAQNAIKKVLAYSTISQLGYMFIGVGVGAFSAGIFHLMTHAFFKACLFLCAGSVIHAMGEREDIQQMGGLWKKLPHTHWTFLASVLAITGAPFFSGFFSKDEILWRAFAASQAYAPWIPKLVWVLGVVGAGMTAFYMFRLYFLTFGGKYRGAAEIADRVKEPTPLMYLPQSILAVLAIIGGFVGMPHLFHMLPNYFHHYLESTVREIPPAGTTSQEWGTMGLGLGMALLGFSVAWLLYGKGPSLTLMKITSSVPKIYKAFANKFYIDELYGLVVVRPIGWIASLCYRVIDRFIIDKVMVEGSATLADAAGWSLRKLHSGIFHRYGWFMAAGAAIFIYFGAVPRPKFDITAHKDGTVVFSQIFTYADYKYSWDFDGDGKFEMIWTPSNVVRHKYKKPGKYKAILRTRSSWGFEREKEFEIIIEESER